MTGIGVLRPTLCVDCINSLVAVRSVSTESLLQSNRGKGRFAAGSAFAVMLTPSRVRLISNITVFMVISWRKGRVCSVIIRVTAVQTVSSNSSTI